jgi:predicted MFS family arabinose efflux permease
VGLTALATGYLASLYGLRPEPFYLGVGYAVVGLVVSAFLVRDTREHVRLEEESHPPEPSPLTFREVFAKTTYGDRNLFACSQAGLVNNLNDGMSWGVFPLFFANLGLGVGRIGILKAIYPAVWGTLQVATGPLSDRWGRKGLIVAGMWVLGLGTAMVYPSLIAAVSDASHPSWRARSLSVYRFWRDLGYAVGALSAGVIADTLGISWAIGSVGALTFLSGVVVALYMREGTEGSVGSEKGRSEHEEYEF